ncbi:MAG TPA: hypothetical protein VFU29_23175 [Chitinophagaceae bacterium]|nr:hypothetical protein [Chitinophagaceae bacterium]
MKKLYFFLILLSTKGDGQTLLISGDYGELKLAYDKNTKQVTGFYENGTGVDEQTGNSKFTCFFYFEGKLLKNKATIKTYYPLDTAIIKGELKVEAKEIKIHLDSEHGGCWNVLHFTDEAVSFSMDESKQWIQVRYAIRDRVYFYSEKKESSKNKSYILKGNIVYIEKIERDWAYCSYLGKKTTKGWIKMNDLSPLKSS